MPNNYTPDNAEFNDSHSIALNEAVKAIMHRKFLRSDKSLNPIGRISCIDMEENAMRAFRIAAYSYWGDNLTSDTPWTAWYYDDQTMFLHDHKNKVFKAISRTQLNKVIKNTWDLHHKPQLHLFT